MTEYSGVKGDRNGDGKSEEDEKKRCSKKEINDSNIKAVVEEHVLSENVPTFYVDDHNEVPIVIPSINKIVSTNHRSNKLFKK